MGSIVIRHWQSPAGRLALASHGGRLCMCDWADSASHAASLAKIERALGAQAQPGESAVIDLAISQLEEYFAGGRRAFAVPLEPVGTAFQRQVWDELQSVGYGTAVAYAHIARRIGRPSAVRAVANAVGANPISIFVPCHRVIGADGSLTGYSGGLDAKRVLLRLEGLIL